MTPAVKRKEDDEVTEALEETFPASDPAAYATPQVEHRSPLRGRRITATSWLAVLLSGALVVWLISLAF